MRVPAAAPLISTLASLGVSTVSAAVAGNGSGFGAASVIGLTAATIVSLGFGFALGDDEEEPI